MTVVCQGLLLPNGKEAWRLQLIDNASLTPSTMHSKVHWNSCRSVAHLLMEIVAVAVMLVIADS